MKNFILFRIAIIFLYVGYITSIVNGAAISVICGNFYLNTSYFKWGSFFLALFCLFSLVCVNFLATKFVRLLRKLNLNLLGIHIAILPTLLSLLELAYVVEKIEKLLH
jgi:hypothetical protein